MIRTALALTLAPVAGGARPCTCGSGHGYQWRTRSMANVKFDNVTTKRHARHLGTAST